jgi:hypothetical protein
MTHDTDAAQRVAEELVAEWRNDFEGAYCSGINSELVAAIATALRAEYARGLRDAAGVASDYGRQVPAGRMFADRIAAAIAKLGEQK